MVNFKIMIEGARHYSDRLTNLPASAFTVQVNYLDANNTTGMATTDEA